MEILKNAPATASAATPSYDDLNAAYLKGIQEAADTAIQNLTPGEWAPVNSATIGSFPWFWQSIPNFNYETYAWFNNVFAYNEEGYYETQADSLNTSLYNLFTAMSYAMSAADEAALNAEVNANQAICQTVLQDYQTLFGPAVGTTTAAQLNYVTGVILSWSTTPGLTLSQLSNALNPISLLGNAPFGTTQLINDFMTYLNATASVQTLQNAVATYNNEIKAIKNNLQVAPATSNPGWMTAITSSTGKTQMVPYLSMSPSVAGIQNSLFPSSGGSSFSFGLAASYVDSTTCKVSVSGSAAVSAPAGFFSWTNASTKTSYDLTTFNSNTATVSVNMSYNGLTAVTPVLSQSQYNVSTGYGWWMPSFISEAANNTKGATGLSFNPQPVSIDFAENGNFGVLSNIYISQMPTFSLTYQSTDISTFQEVFSQTSKFSVKFLGITLDSGSESTYSSTVTQDVSAKTITVTMSPPVGASPVSTLDQMAYVVGAALSWPGAPTA